MDILQNRQVAQNGDSQKIPKGDRMRMYDIIVIGGGISGIYTAYKIHKKSQSLFKSFYLQDPNAG